MNKQLIIKDIALIGRTFDEYSKMFSLDKYAIAGLKILDAASGVSSFCSEANAKGYKVTAADRIYEADLSEIEYKWEVGWNIIMKQLPDIADVYVWNYFKDINSLIHEREKAYNVFLEDFKRHGKERYIPTEFPDTGFSYKQFDISLVSHLLFLYDERLDYLAHKKILRELIRITSKDIRIFPLVNLKGLKSTFIGNLLNDCDFNDVSISIEKTDYEFMKSGDEMMVIRCLPRD